MNSLSKSVKIYLSSVIALGAFMAIYLMQTYGVTLNFDIFIFIIMAIIAESLLIPLPNQGGVSVGFAIVLPSIIFFGPGIAMFIILIENIFMVVKQEDKFYHIFNIPFYKTAFNIGMYCISAGISALLYVVLGGEYGNFSLGNSMLPILICAFFYLLINGLLLAGLLSTIHKKKFIAIWVSDIRWTIPNFIAIASLSAMIALAYGFFGIEAVMLLFGPLLLARYSFKLYLDMKKNYMETIQALSAAMEQKDPYTQGHAQRVCELSELLGQELKLTTYEIEQLRYAAILHDIGKIGIPESILNKPGSLTKEEFDKIKNHPIMGVNILQKIDFLKEVTIIMESHHEYYDGSGYPKGLVSDEIPFLSRIITLADAYDAMTTDRPYRDALTAQYAYNEIKEKSGSQFDPKVVDVFEKLFKEGKVVDA